MRGLVSSLLMLTGSLLCAQSSKTDFVVTIKTVFGDMTAILYDQTPLHKANFLELAKTGQYDSTIFHRVIKDFMIQGGDVTRKPGAAPAEDDDRVPAEIVEGLFHRKGELAAARTNNPEKKSSNCQFYIVQGKVYTEAELTIDQNNLNRVFAQLMQEGKIDSLRNCLIELQEEKKFDEMTDLINDSCDYLEDLSGEKIRKDVSPEMVEAYTTVGGTPHLDNEYTVFGRVIVGFDVIDKIATVDTARGDVPKEPVYMSMEVIEMKKKKITKLYGYTYPAE